MATLYAKNASQTSRRPERQTSPESPMLTPPATRTTGNESPSAIGARMTRPQSHAVLPGRRHHSTASARTASATRRSDAYGFTSPAYRSGQLETANTATANRSASPRKSRPAT